MSLKNDIQNLKTSFDNLERILEANNTTEDLKLLDSLLIHSNN